MNLLLLKSLARAGGLADAEPLLALFLGAALLAVFLTEFFRPTPPEPGAPASLPWTLYRLALRLSWSTGLVVLLLGAGMALHSYVSQSASSFEAAHGRVTAANYDAVQTIWGPEQQQNELTVEIFNEEEITERIESEDLTKPAILRKKTVRLDAIGNPYLSEHHTVTLIQNPRQKGSALYDGYETDNSFSWSLRNPAVDREQCILTLPLPAAHAVYNSLVATLNGEDVLPNLQIRDGNLRLALTLEPNETMDFHLGFKSRGLSSWYFQIPQSREIRDFTLTLSLPDLSVRQLNYPWGCMTPTAITPGANGTGAMLTYHLDHALSNKGMGIVLPQLPQPGAATRAVLAETGRAWMLAFAMLALGLTLAGARQAVLLAVLFGAGIALAYGLLAGFSDLLFGFWGTAGMVVGPLILFLAWLLKRVGGAAGTMLALELVLVSLVYPCAAGLDPLRQDLYLNLFGLWLLACNTWLLVRRLNLAATETPPATISPAAG